jgi:hypothetical protein
MKAEAKQIICWGIAAVFQISAILVLIYDPQSAKLTASILQSLAILAAFGANYFGTKKTQKPAVTTSEVQQIVSRELAALYGNLHLPKRKDDKKYEGLSVNMVLRLHLLQSTKRKYIFDIGEKDRNRFSLYFDASNTIILAAIDTNGEPILARIPLGELGVPIEQFVFLSCELGLRSASTFLRAYVNGEEVGRVEIPIRVALGPIRIKGSTIGSDLDGNNAGSFDSVQFAAYTVTLTTEEVTGLLNNFMGKPRSHYLSFTTSQWMRIDANNNLGQQLIEARPKLVKIE